REARPVRVLRMEAACFNSLLGGVRQSSGRGSRSVCATVSPWGVSWAASHVRDRQERKLVERRSCHDARLQRTVLVVGSHERERFFCRMGLLPWSRSRKSSAKSTSDVTPYPTNVVRPLSINTSAGTFNMFHERNVATKSGLSTSQERKVAESLKSLRTCCSFSSRTRSVAFQVAQQLTTRRFSVASSCCVTCAVDGTQVIASSAQRTAVKAAAASGNHEPSGCGAEPVVLHHG